MSERERKRKGERERECVPECESLQSATRGVKEREVRGGKKEDGEKWNSAEKRKLFEARQDEKKRANKTVV